jgi:hypothetical protein
VKTFTVSQAKVRLGKLVEEVHKGAPILLVHKNKLVKLERFEVLDPEYDSPELEAALLEAVQGPHAKYSRTEMQTILDRVCNEERPRAKTISRKPSGYQAPIQ